MKSQDSYFATKLKNIHVSNLKFTLTYENSKNFFVATMKLQATAFWQYIRYLWDIHNTIGLNLKKSHVKTQLNYGMQCCGKGLVSYPIVHYVRVKVIVSYLLNLVLQYSLLWYICLNFTKIIGKQNQNVGPTIQANVSKKNMALL